MSFSSLQAYSSGGQWLRCMAVYLQNLARCCEGLSVQGQVRSTTLEAGLT